MVKRDFSDSKNFIYFLSEVFRRGVEKISDSYNNKKINA
jgi:hypothetical protein